MIILKTIRPNGGGEVRLVRNVVVRSLGALERGLNVRIAFAGSVDVDIQQPKSLFSRRLRLSGHQR